MDGRIDRNQEIRRALLELKRAFHRQAGNSNFEIVVTDPELATYIRATIRNDEMPFFKHGQPSDRLAMISDVKILYKGN